MRLANIQSIDFASLKILVKGYITKKTKKIDLTCQTRHTKPCKKFTSERCRFGNDCAYMGKNVPNIKERCEHTEKLKC